MGNLGLGLEQGLKWPSLAVRPTSGLGFQQSKGPKWPSQFETVWPNKFWASKIKARSKMALVF